MIEALIVCSTFLGVEDCVIYNYTDPMPRSEDTEQITVEHCEGIVQGMLGNGFTVTCEEYVYEEEA